MLSRTGCRIVFPLEQEDYQQWELPKHEQPASREANRKALPFNGTSSYADTYIVHALEPCAPSSPVHPGRTGTFKNPCCPSAQQQLNSIMGCVSWI